MPRVNRLFVLIVGVLSTTPIIQGNSGVQCGVDSVPRYDPDLCCNMEEVTDKNIVQQCKTKHEDMIKTIRQQQQQQLDYMPTGCVSLYFQHCIGPIGELFSHSVLLRVCPQYHWIPKERCH